MNINVLILAAGPSGLETHNRDYPLCMTEFGGSSLLERIVTNTRGLEGADYSFAFLRNETEKFHLDKVANLLAPNANVFRMPVSTKGSACTALLASSQLESDCELLIISANELVDIDLSTVVSDFRSRDLAAGVLIFQSIHPRYSYVRLNHERFVTEAAQQDPISRHATTGVFWFAKTKDFVASAMSLIRKDATVSGSFYIAPTLNELILNQAKIGVFELDLEKYIPLKSDRQAQQFEQGTRA